MADRDSFEEFVAGRYAALVRSAYLLVGNRADAEDLVQTALAKVVPVWQRIEEDPERYVRTVLVRESVNRWRRRRWREVGVAVLPDRADRPEPETAVADRLGTWLGQGTDVFAYFNNDYEGAAVTDATWLRHRLGPG